MLEQHRDTFKKNSKYARENRSSSHNSYGAFVLEDETYVQIGPWVCHGWLSNYNMTECHRDRRAWSVVKIKYVLSAVMKPHKNVTDKALLNYIDWLVNRSPWASVFVVKDATDILDKGYVVDANNSAAFITSAFIASRFPTESYTAEGVFQDRWTMYQELLDMGCGETESLLFSQWYAPKRGKNIYPVEFSRLQSGHSIFYGFGTQEDYARNFLRSNPVNVEGSYISNGKGYGHETINSIWGKTSTKDSFGNALMTLTPISKMKKDDHHIFRKAPSKGFAYKDREDFMSIIEQVRGMINA